MNDANRYTTSYAMPVNESAERYTTTISISKEEYVQHALDNLQRTSRTANGVVDTSASASKAETMQATSGEIAATTAQQNFIETMESLYDNRDITFASPAEVRHFLEGVALSINDGITKEGVLYRSGEDSTKYAYTRIKDLDREMDGFSEELYELMQSDMYDPVEVAGWMEYRIDMTDHFFADGCGKVAKAASAWMLMRHNRPLPVYRSREELYAHAPETIRHDDPVADQKGYEYWSNYYRSLFTEEVA